MEVGFYTNNFVNSYNSKRVRGQKEFNGLDILGSSSKEVKDAWNKAEKASGVNGYGMNSDGKMTQLTTLFAMWRAGITAKNRISWEILYIRRKERSKRRLTD